MRVEIFRPHFEARDIASKCGLTFVRYVEENWEEKAYTKVRDMIEELEVWQKNYQNLLTPLQANKTDEILQRFETLRRYMIK